MFECLETQNEADGEKKCASISPAHALFGMRALFFEVFRCL